MARTTRFSFLRRIPAVIAMILAADFLFLGGSGGIGSWIGALAPPAGNPVANAVADTTPPLTGAPRR